MAGFWEWLGENGTQVAAAAALLTAVAATVGIGVTAADSRRRTRPYVVLEYRRIPYVNGTLALVMSNMGQTMARRVRVKFDDLGPEAAKSDSLVSFVQRRYSRVITSLAPGQQLSNVVRTRSRNATEADCPPDQVRARVSYWSGWRRYRGSFDLDLTVYAEETMTSSSSAPEAALQNIAKELEAVGVLARLLSEREVESRFNG